VIEPAKTKDLASRIVEALVGEDEADTLAALAYVSGFVCYATSADDGTPLSEALDAFDGLVRFAAESARLGDRQMRVH
jgi:hypothetical protein